MGNKKKVFCALLSATGLAIGSTSLVNGIDGGKILKSKVYSIERVMDKYLLEKDLNSKIDPNVVQTEAERKGLDTNKNSEDFYDIKDFMNDLKYNPNIGQEIDPNVVQTEKERKRL